MLDSANRRHRKSYAFPGNRMQVITECNDRAPIVRTRQAAKTPVPWQAFLDLGVLKFLSRHVSCKTVSRRPVFLKKIFGT